MRTTTLLVGLALASSISAASNAAEIVELENGRELVIESTPHTRLLPYVFYDQGMASLPELFPDYELLASRRFGRLGEVSYSLLAYKEDAESAQIILHGIAEKYPMAWNFRASANEEDFIGTLLQMIEVLSKLPSKQAVSGGPEGSVAPPPRH